MHEPPRSSILLLDDDAILREVITAQLRAAGYKVSASARIADAVALASNMQFDHLLIDQRLGDDDGIVALKALRQCAGARSAHAIAISAELGDALRVELAHAGYVTALEKPVAMSELLTVVGGNSPSAATRTAADAGECTLDDVAALAIWGSKDTVDMLRAMLLPELDVYRAAVVQVCADSDMAQLRELLHRMRSSAGFCGARGLLQFVDTALAGPPDWSNLLQRYDAVCAALRPALRASTAT